MQTVRGSSRFLEERGEGLINRMAVVAWAVVVALFVGACGSGEGTTRPESATPAPARTPNAAPTLTDPATTQPDPTVDHPREWVAVFRVAELEQLEEETQELLRLVPRNIAISPIGCWVGLREKLGNPSGESVYVSAVVAESREELELVVQKVGREPMLTGQFPLMCT